MKKIIIFVIGIIALISLFLIVRSFMEPNKKTVDTVFLGPQEYKATFDESVKGAGQFYDLYGQARDRVKAGDYDNAIKLLNESLSYIGDGLEKGMVYRKLAEIYRTQGNLEKELFYIEEFPKYSMNKELNEEAKVRAAEIRRLLSTKNQTSQQ